jgi:hypothetical protein
MMHYYAYDTTHVQPAFFCLHPLLGFLQDGIVERAILCWLASMLSKLLAYRPQSPERVRRQKRQGSISRVLCKARVHRPSCLLRHVSIANPPRHLFAHRPSGGYSSVICSLAGGSMKAPQRGQVMQVRCETWEWKGNSVSAHLACLLACMHVGRLEQRLVRTQYHSTQPWACMTPGRCG